MKSHVLLCAGFLPAFFGGTFASKPVQVSLRSSWPAPPFLLELLETVALENPDAFFPLLNHLTDPKTPVPYNSLSPEALHQAVLYHPTTLGLLTEHGALAAVEMNLALHAATPKIEAFYHHYVAQHSNTTFTSPECGSWVQWYTDIVCDVETLAHLVGVETLDPPPPSPLPSDEKESVSARMDPFGRPQILPFDHIHPAPSHTLRPPPRTAILYADIESANFRELHEYLLKVSDAPNPPVEYVFRYVPSPAITTTKEKEKGKGKGAERNYLSGYGVALDLKKMDYLAVDDRHSSRHSDEELNEEQKNGSESLEGMDRVLALIHAYPEEPTFDESPSQQQQPLTDEEIQNLGRQATQLIADSPNPLDTLTLLSQNFPKYATSLARRVVVTPSVEDEIHANNLKAQGGVHMFWLNGMMVTGEKKDLTPLGLLRLLRKERAVMRGLTGELTEQGGGGGAGAGVGVGLSRSQALEVLTSPLVAPGAAAGAAGGQGEVLDGLVDASDREEGGGVVVYWNDLEKDSRYASWPRSLIPLVRAMYPGSFPTTRLNLINIITILDLSKITSLNFLATSMKNIIDRNLPFRFGLVARVGNEDARRMARFCYQLIETHGRKATLEVLKNIVMGQAALRPQDTSVNWDIVRTAYNELIERDEDTDNDNDNDGAGEGQTGGEEETSPSSSQGKKRKQALLDFDSILDGSDGEGGGSEDGGEAFVLPVGKLGSYAKRLGIVPSSDVGGDGNGNGGGGGDGDEGDAFVNGRHFVMDDGFFRSLQVELNKQVEHLQEQTYLGHISDDKDLDTMSTYFYDQPSTSKRRNRFIVPSSGSGSPSSGGLRVFALPELLEKSGFEYGPGAFLYAPGTKTPILSLHIVADFDSEEGLALVREALLSIDAESQTRVTFVHNPYILPWSIISGDGDNPPPTRKPDSTSWLIAHLVVANKLSHVSVPQLLSALGLEHPHMNSDFIVQDGGGEDATTGAQSQAKLSRQAARLELLAATGSGSDGFLDREGYAKYWKSSLMFAKEIGIVPGQRGIVVNGRVIGPLKAGDFGPADFKELERYEAGKRAAPAVSVLESVAPEVLLKDRASSAHVVSVVSSVLAAIQLPDPSEFSLFDTPPRPRARKYQLLDSKHTMFEFGNNATALYHIAVLLDPLSETTQRWASLLEWLSALPDVFIEVHLHPAKYEEMPLKRFYRYNLHASLAFDEDGNEIPARTVFDDLPVEPIYTLAMDVPTSWLVRPREALYDLDNIQLGNIAPEHDALEAVFDLDYLVIEGHAREVPGNSPPRGVQLQLVEGDDKTAIDDTQVVANLGYFQFKAKPGVFKLEIREGRGRDIYKMQSVGNEGWDSPAVGSVVGSEITLMSFEGLTLFPRLERWPGMEMEDVLEEPGTHGEEKKSILDRVFSLFRPEPIRRQEVAVAKAPQADINIFTVASGLLYERFVSIMILSVLRNTNSTVKFWFIENFLSPSFLEFIPHLAEAYNFQYELVTYKWPSWLRAQKEKQRIIWAYKILFLDVLFPMDLKKVIFVDADQIVRADLKELVDLDLEGAPYGYTPMGDDNTDMEGFRFWKTGYWKEFLQGKPYHISALYVIDLVRFRQLAAGDILRGQYQQLSADPGSLANLDQDLPNNIQRQVPIYSLHEDWLWCETWCSKDRLHRAKTIDLCQNPLTKEPKLARARQIPEWEEYDREISHFARKLAAEGLIQSHVAAADANALAGETAAAAGAGVPSQPSPAESGVESEAETVEPAKPTGRDEL